jgi:hypothetical protein
MVIIPDSTAVVNGLVHRRPDHLDHRCQQLHRHYHGGSADSICVDHIFIGYGSDHAGYGSNHPATALTTPTTRRPLPRYKERVIDNTDLIKAINQVSHKLSQTLTLVDSIQNQSTE